MKVRDLRLDFFRGVALLLIVTYHVMGNHLTWFAVGQLWYADAAETFVFISGFVCGLVYMPVLLRDGWLACQQKALKRCGQLYIAQIILLGLTVGLVWVFTRDGRINPEHFRMTLLLKDPFGAIPYAMAMLYTPWLVDILKLYMVLLLAMPTMFWLYSRNRWLGIGASLAMYLPVQAWHHLTLYEYPGGVAWFLDPLGWQLLFFMGSAIAIESKRGWLRVPKQGWMVALAALGLVLLAVCNAYSLLPGRSYDRPFMAPVRVLNFLLFVYLVYAILPAHLAFWRSRLAAPVVACGQNSLQIFCVTVVVSYIISLLLLEFDGRTLTQAVLVCLGCSVTLMAGVLLARGKAGVPQSVPDTKPDRGIAVLEGVLGRADGTKERPMEALMLPLEAAMHAEDGTYRPFATQAVVRTEMREAVPL